MSTGYTLYVKFIKNKVLKLHSCLIAFCCTKPRVKTQVLKLFTNKVNDEKQNKKVHPAHLQLQILVLKNVAGIVCALSLPSPSTCTCAHKQRMLQPRADDSPVLQGKRHRKYFGHLFRRNAPLEIDEGLSGADGSVWPPQCSRQRH